MANTKLSRCSPGPSVDGLLFDQWLVVKVMVDATVLDYLPKTKKHKLRILGSGTTTDATGEISDVPLKGPNQQGNAVIWVLKSCSSLQPQAPLESCGGMVKGMQCLLQDHA